jgi:membrane protease YdiL (CAAX protease family)
MAEDSHPAPDPGKLIILAILFEGSLAPLAVFLGWLLDQPALTGFGWRAKDVLLGILATLPMLGLFILGQSWPVGPFRAINQFLEEEVKPILSVCRWPDLVLIALAAGVGEEMLFRGVFQGALARWLGPGWGWGAASVLFGLLHPITPGYIALATLLGAYLGALWIYTGNLLSVMVAHGVYDFLALVYLLRKGATAV